jgi:hypothetical protein
MGWGMVFIMAYYIGESSNKANYCEIAIEKRHPFLLYPSTIDNLLPTLKIISLGLFKLKGERK